MRLIPMLTLLLPVVGLPPAAAAQGQWESFRSDGWQGAGVCPFGEIADGGYFCLELACPDGGPLGFRVRLTEAEVQPVVEALWTVNRRDAGRILMAPLEGAPGQYYAPYDADRDARLIERMRQGSEGSFTIVNRPIRAVRPFALSGSFGPITAALDTCPLDMPLEARAPAPDEVIEVVPVEPQSGDVILVVPADPEPLAPDAEIAAPGAPPAEAVRPADAAADAEVPEAPDDPEDAEVPEALDDPEQEAQADAADDPPDDPLVAEDGSVGDPAALVLQEIETACVERGGGFVEVTGDFVRRADFDGDGIEDMEVSYSAAVCDAAAGLYCDTESCLTRVYLGREDGRFVPAFEDIYMSARTMPAFVVTYDAGSDACPAADEPCEQVFVWVEGRLVPVDLPQP